jgi:hypothetical protein
MATPPLVAKPARPVYLDLLSIRQPLPGVVSILHRASGALLFLVGIPLALWGLQASPARRTPCVVRDGRLASDRELVAGVACLLPPARRRSPPAARPASASTRAARRQRDRARAGDRPHSFIAIRLWWTSLPAW